MTSEGFRVPPQSPLVFTDTAASVLEKIDKLQAQTKAVIDKVVAEVRPEDATFATVLRPLLLDENLASATNCVSMVYNNVSADKELRDASRDAEERIDEFVIDATMREDFFKLVEAAYSTRESQNLDVESLRILEKERQRCVNNGLLLVGAQRDRFKEIQKRISQLCTRGCENLSEEAGGSWFTPEQLEGVPSDDVNIEELEKGTGENEGKVKVSFQGTHFGPLMRYAVREDTRREYYIQEANSVNENGPLFQEIIELRDEAARMVGYKDHASLKISTTMAKSSDRVQEFLDGLQGKVQKAGDKELANLLQYKEKDCKSRGLAFDGKIYAWDVPYYNRLFLEQECDVDESAISQYFPLESTMRGLLDIFEKLLGFRFLKLTEEDRARISPTGKFEDLTWHKDVHLYSVWNDETTNDKDDFCGYLYLDLHPRDGKCNQDFNFDLDSAFDNADGSRHYASTALICNVTKPTAEKPALMKHEDIITLFHELGHGIHGLSSRTKYAKTHGLNVAWDFLETPSQMLENWCWLPSVLKSLSQHWQTGEKIPDQLIDSLIKTRYVDIATIELKTILRSKFDMVVHSGESHEAVQAMSCSKIFNQLRKDITGIDGPESIGLGMEWGNIYLTFDHYITGYDAGYYSYLWSEVFSSDLFSMFKDDPMSEEQGRRYRRLVLERGGSLDEMGILKEFLGREPSSEPFYKNQLGLV